MPEPGAGEFGIVLRAAAHRLGLASKAPALVEPFAFGALGLNELRANIDAENAASLWLFSHAGFAHSAAIPGDRTSDGAPPR
ncbi:GNAT family N-acetyltransferase [Candidatus Viadribacter manganicus]|uniref:GNAT family N-acetyltransferase n=1 Tax=Candidatus Viadribacter manganicus TaxID=1759059 RepID=UPI0009F5D369